MVLTEASFLIQCCASLASSVLLGEFILYYFWNNNEKMLNKSLFAVGVSKSKRWWKNLLSDSISHSMSMNICGIYVVSVLAVALQKYKQKFANLWCRGQIATGK